MSIKYFLSGGINRVDLGTAVEVKYPFAGLNEIERKTIANLVSSDGYYSDNMFRATVRYTSFVNNKVRIDIVIGKYNYFVEATIVFPPGAYETLYATDRRGSPGVKFPSGQKLYGNIVAEMNVNGVLFSMYFVIDLIQIWITVLPSARGSFTKQDITDTLTGRPPVLRAPPTDARIKIFANTEIIYGANLMIVVFRVLDNLHLREYIRRPRLTKMVNAKGCTLTEKTYELLVSTEDPLTGIVSYGMLRYFLWFLITRKWCITILKRRYTRKFFSVLAQSQYNIFVPAFEELGLNIYEKYFIW